MEGLEGLLGVVAANPEDVNIQRVISAMSDFEAHTLETISQIVWEEWGEDIGGCYSASLVSAIPYKDAWDIKWMGPYDSFGGPTRFKLVMVLS